MGNEAFDGPYVAPPDAFSTPSVPPESVRDTAVHAIEGLRNQGPACRRGGACAAPPFQFRRLDAARHPAARQPPFPSVRWRMVAASPLLDVVLFDVDDTLYSTTAFAHEGPAQRRARDDRGRARSRRGARAPRAERGGHGVPEQLRGPLRPTARPPGARAASATAIPPSSSRPASSRTTAPRRRTCRSCPTRGRCSTRCDAAGVRTGVLSDGLQVKQAEKLVRLDVLRLHRPRRHLLQRPAGHQQAQPQDLRQGLRGARRRSRAACSTSATARRTTWRPPPPRASRRSSTAAPAASTSEDPPVHAGPRRVGPAASCSPSSGDATGCPSDARATADPGERRSPRSRDRPSRGRRATCTVIRAGGLSAK